VIFFDLAVCSEKEVKTIGTEPLLAEWVQSPPDFLFYRSATVDRCICLTNPLCLRPKLKSL